MEPGGFHSDLLGMTVQGVCVEVSDISVRRLLIYFSFHFLRLSGMTHHVFTVAIVLFMNVRDPIIPVDTDTNTSVRSPS